jgi:hypothetical protein
MDGTLYLFGVFCKTFFNSYVHEVPYNDIKSDLWYRAGPR